MRSTTLVSLLAVPALALAQVRVKFYIHQPHICFPSFFSAPSNTVLSPHRVPLPLLLRLRPPPQAQELRVALKTNLCNCQRRSSPLLAWITIIRLQHQSSRLSSPLQPNLQRQAHRTLRRMELLLETRLRRARHLSRLFPRLHRASMVEATHQEERLAQVHRAPAAHLDLQMTISRLHCH